uniref:Protein kinase n=1 Tax=Pithovirus LCPAC202 TaxID=2506592 RepID=A0A481Z594_9VIRU|nr:MAG: protein kinase [Pithovirus LCPAC202]
MTSKSKKMIGPSTIRVVPNYINKKGTACGRTEPQVDRALEKIDQIRNQAISELVKNPEEFIIKLWEKSLSKDKSCKFQMGNNNPTLKERLEGNINFLSSDKYAKCNGCRLLESIVPPNGNIKNKTFSPKSGKSRGLKYSILKVEGVISKNFQTGQQDDIIRQIVQQNELAQTCQPHLSVLSKAKYFSLDSFSNRLLISWYLEKVLGKSKMPHLRKIYYGFICANDGYYLIEENKYLKFSDLNKLSPEIIFSILYQLFALFHRLRNYDLSFHVIDQNTFLLEDSPCHYEYDGVQITGEMTLKINNLSGAGISTYSRKNPDQIVRIYKSSTQPEKRFEKVFFKSINWSEHHELSTSPGEIPKSWVSYKVSGNGLEQEQRTAFLYANRMGLPLYQSSFDIYRLILLLASNSKIYEIITKDSELSKIWSSFWIPSEYKHIQKKIKSHQFCLYRGIESPDFCSLATILTGLTLRCDIVEHVWSLLKDFSNRNR